MKLVHVTVHNLRSLKHVSFNLTDYSIIIGPNNAGKSNVLSALRLFYENDKLTFSRERDFPKFATDDNESWVELHFQTTNEEQEQLRDEYKSPDSVLRVRRYFLSDDKDRVKAGQSNIYTFEGGELSRNLFYGAKNISQAKLGNVIHIPAVSKADDAFKLSGQPLLGQIAIEPVATRTGLVGEDQLGGLALQPANQFVDVALSRGDGTEEDDPGTLVGRVGHGDGVFVNVQADEKSGRVIHG